MNIHITNNYRKEVYATFEGHFDVQSLKKYLEEEVLIYTNDSEIGDNEIEGEILEFLKQEDCEIDPFNTGDEPCAYSVENREGLEVINLEELVKYFSYLKRLPVKNNCCIGQTCNYCPECGKKLK